MKRLRRWWRWVRLSKAERYALMLHSADLPAITEVYEHRPQPVTAKHIREMRDGTAYGPPPWPERDGPRLPRFEVKKR